MDMKVENGNANRTRVQPSFKYVNPPEGPAVRLVAVRAGDPGPEHPALDERPVLVDPAKALAVGVIEADVEERWRVFAPLMTRRPGSGTARGSGARSPPTEARGHRYTPRGRPRDRTEGEGAGGEW